MRYVAVYVWGENEPIQQKVNSSEKTAYIFYPGDMCKIIPLSFISQDQKYLGLVGKFTGHRGSPGKVYVEFYGREPKEIDICNLVAPSLFGQIFN